MPRRDLTAVWLMLCVLAVSAGSAYASHSLVDRVKNGPAAAMIRESYRCLERGEATDDNPGKLAWYNRGKELAEAAVRRDELDPDAHFALFANWGRWLQIDGWLKNSFHLPALRRELERTLALDPDHADALAAEGGLYLELPRFLGGDPSKAESLLVRSIALDPEAVGARLELADCYAEKDRKNEARELAAAALRLATEQGEPHFVERASKMLVELGPSPEHAEAKR